ncbi:ribosome maturation factor RimM [Aliarcobacter skirrowii]|uniref:Ribosome maturation factor RimM n=1 Tax=Aliarcobacter skirrowii CCUG 10374 TaxID=1032239 RepID=A0AAD0WP77_9BACT|nr:ribosome maturation factor RimM [Aliarcobacter skirrowii]AXX85466.1 16S rRNA processing protein [Aliarcobacter skirrowii CCUG 10374]KAB0621125.1 16S rRNA processing protein RimM [Aliarcobacter skirrowii CCUG 10374]MDX4038721.1 ribosome maturation factor RimM [Aliarcobacter skirrowii]RXI26296.1 16S rRNA processing protein RimM [Aliarcobacter skirrowii CCUG 10374]SUU95999.1 Ribosome maturation factor rimM [Aliarcobacter skirrowii]
MNNKVYVAKLGKAVGLKGHLRLFIDSDFPEQFKKGSTFLTNKNFQLTILEYLKDRDLVSFEGFSDIESAKKLTNTELYTTIEQTKEFCKLKDNEFFWFDLISCEVYEDSLKLGVVSDVHRFPLNDYLEVKTDSQLVEKGLPKIFLIPHIFETFIQRVDIENKKIFAINAFDILENS